MAMTSLRMRTRELIQVIFLNGSKIFLQNCLTKYLMRKNTMAKNAATRISNSAMEIRDTSVIRMREAKLAGAVSRARRAGIASRH